MSDAQAKPSQIVVALQQKFPTDKSYSEACLQLLKQDTTGTNESSKSYQWVLERFRNILGESVQLSTVVTDRDLWLTKALDQLLLEEDKRRQGLSNDLTDRCGCAMPYQHAGKRLHGSTPSRGKGEDKVKVGFRAVMIEDAVLLLEVVVSVAPLGQTCTLD
ncbi:hypothetical protein RDABS01_024040 [Bienertia sinuspersici]